MLQLAEGARELAVTSKWKLDFHFEVTAKISYPYWLTVTLGITFANVASNQ